MKGDRRQRRTARARRRRRGRRFEGLDRDELLAVYRVMLLSRKLDDKEIQLKNQSQIFFQISGAGHEAMLVAAGLTLQAGLRLVLPVLSRSRAVPAARRDAARDAARRGRRRSTIPSSRRPPDAVALGPHRPQHRLADRAPTGTQVLHAVGAAEAGVIYSRVAEIPDRDVALPRRRVVYVSLGEGATSEGEFWEALNTACTKQLPVLFLVEDNGYAISVPVEVQTPGGDISRLVRSFPGPARRLDRRHRLPRQPARDARGGRLRPRAQGPGARPRARHPPVLALAVGRREAVQDAGGARGRSAPRSDRALRRVPASRTAWRPTTTSPRSPPTSSARSNEAALEGAGRAEAARRDTAALWVYSPDVDPTSAAFDTPAAARGQARHDGRGDQPHAEGRDGARPAHRRLRRGRRRRQPRRKR